MALDVWNKPSGYSFGIFQENINLTLPLPVEPLAGVTYTVISGKLPPGVRLVDSTIIGLPNEVVCETTYTFCIRAQSATSLNDRTFSITIQGEDSPVFLTPAGFLQVGTNNQFFVLDNSVVDYQLSAIDSDTIAGGTLNYFISSKDGALPRGLTLSADGRIFGRVQAVTEIRLDDGLGTYDSGIYDASPYDYAFWKFADTYSNFVSNGGYDFYEYDIVYDYAPDQLPLRSLNRNYEFIVTVSDGMQYYDRRSFQIYVIGDAFFRADTTALLSNTGMFTTDVSYLHSPVWLTSSNLGTYRANNYITLVLDVYDIGRIFYRFETTTTKWKQLQQYKVNDLIYINSKLTYICTTAHTSGTEFTTANWHKYGLPPGMKFDERTSEVFGYVQYQSSASETYKFRITAYRYGDITSDVASTSQTFTVDIISEVNSVLVWDTNNDLGFLDAGYKSILAVRATSSITNSQLIYKITAGQLPPGLSMSLNGEISGVINHYITLLSFDSSDVTFDYNRTTFKQLESNQGLLTFDFNPTLQTTFDDLLTIIIDTTFNKYKTIDVGTMSFDYNLNTGQETTFNADGYVLFRDSLTNTLDKETEFDSGTTTIDHTFSFDVLVTDQYIFSSIIRTFTVEVGTTNRLSYSNMYVKPFLNLVQRGNWSAFINDPGIFTLSSMYRPLDSNFGIQTDLAMLVYAGIETKHASEFARTIVNNFKKKQFRFGGVSKATAMPIGTSTPLYEVVYVNIIDPLEINNTHLPSTIVSNNSTYYPSSVELWRNHIATAGSTKGNLLPLWMQSIQPGTRTELGYVLAVPLCYCKVGTADDIILNIKYSNFDFNSINYTIDRLIIDAVSGYTGDKYIIFNNNRETI